jgi:hypothetical protein
MQCRISRPNVLVIFEFLLSDDDGLEWDWDESTFVSQEDLFIVSGNQISFGVIPTVSGNSLLTGINLITNDISDSTSEGKSLLTGSSIEYGSAGTISAYLKVNFNGTEYKIPLHAIS